MTRRAVGVMRGLAFGGTLYGALVGTSMAILPTRRGGRAERVIVTNVVRRLIPTSLVAAGISLDVRGREHLANPTLAGGYVLVANHASNLDPIAIMEAVGRYDLTFVAKVETLRRPLLGRILEALPWLGVERESVAALKKLCDDVRARQIGGWVPQLVVFPEGTRSEDGRLQPFKVGPFLLAAHLGVPVLPVVVRGTFALHRKNAFAVYPGRVQVDIHAPLVTPPMPAGLRGRQVDLAALDTAATLKRQTETIFFSDPELAPHKASEAAA